MKNIRDWKKFENSEEDEISQNLDSFYNTNISLMEFAMHVDRLNSGGDRDCVFYYLEDFLKENGIIIDIEAAIAEEAEG